MTPSEILQSVAGTIYMATITTVGIRLIVLARRNRGLPELLVGLSMLAGGTLGASLEAVGMSGDVYFEHAHRLFGSLVGLTTVVLAFLLQRGDERRWVRRLGWVAVVLVSAQGILGGLRVTGNFTLSTSAADMAPNLALAAVPIADGHAFNGCLCRPGTHHTRGREAQCQSRGIGHGLGQSCGQAISGNHIKPDPRANDDADLSRPS